MNVIANSDASLPRSHETKSSSWSCKPAFPFTQTPSKAGDHQMTSDFYNAVIEKGLYTL